MIAIHSFLHRDLLSDIIRRWMYNEPDPADAEQITSLVHFNHVVVHRYLRLFSLAVLESIHAAPIRSQPVERKGELKDAICERPPYLSDRIEELIRRYRESPGHYYREMPFRGSLFFLDRQDAPRLVGVSRIKRVRRLAEKAARKITDHYFDAIKQRAEDLANDRARRIGVPREYLLTSAEQMLEEFLAAESRVIETIRAGQPIRNGESFAIDDVAGVKIILENRQQEDFYRCLETLACRILEREDHEGAYNATNLIVEYSPPWEEIRRRPLGPGILAMMENRGVRPERAQEEFDRFVRTGEDRVRLEIILSNYQETLESEVGRCMHEDRIIAQRQHRHYRGNLARNIEYLMEYLFTFPLSSQRHLQELPIQLWNRYLPDYLYEVLMRLFEVPAHLTREN